MDLAELFCGKVQHRRCASSRFPDVDPRDELTELQRREQQGNANAVYRPP